MKRHASNFFNKEKLIFVGTAALLAVSLCRLLASTPAKLNASMPVSSLSVPGPLDAEQPDNRNGSVAYYLEHRDRNNPFQPVEIKERRWADAVNPDGPVGPVAGPPGVTPPKPIPIGPTSTDDENNPGGPNPLGGPIPVAKAQFDFSAVMSNGNQTVGHLKSKDGRGTIRVKVGDYLDEYKYTIARIEKRAIWVTDEKQRLFVARDTTFDK